MKGSGALGALAINFLILSLLAFGGANAIIPEMQRQAVEVQHWMTATQFAALFAIAQAAPGPNVMVVTLVGWQIAGVLGAVVATAAMMGPSWVLTFTVFRAWDKFKYQPWCMAIQNGLAPVTVGLVASSAFLLARDADRDAIAFGLTAATAALAYWTRINPLWAFGVAAILGVAGFS
ncbi:MAG: chromate transporter [Alphaproteobacteria bacterium]|nr:chromate transporter [Alphaproteobacteria bacterium]